MKEKARRFCHKKSNQGEVGRPKKVRCANLPAGLGRQTCYLHSIYRSTRTGRSIAIGWSIEVLFVTGSAGKLNCKALPLEVASIYKTRLRRPRAVQEDHVRNTVPIVSRCAVSSGI